LGTLGPGVYREVRIPILGDPHTSVSGDLRFIDAANRSWLRRQGRELERLTGGERTQAMTEDKGAYTEEHPTLGLGVPRVLSLNRVRA
jgi:hypothetical protein